MKKYLKQMILLIVVVAIIVVLKLSGLADYLTLDNLKTNADRLKQFVADNYLISVSVYIVIYVVVTGFSIPGATVLTLAAGFLYGVICGAIYVNIGATTGAAIAFLFARYIAGGSIQNKYADKLAGFNEELRRNGFRYLLTLRFIPIFPFFMINIFAGLTKIPIRTFLWTTSLGILPGSMVYAYAGKQLGTIVSAKDIFSKKILIVFLLLASFAILPIVLKRLRAHKKTDERR